MGAENEARRAAGRKASGELGQQGNRPIPFKAPQPIYPTAAPRKLSVNPNPTRAVHPLRPRTPNGLPTARDAVLGSEEKQERTRGKIVLDLCPGQGLGGGVRPPKRGMDKPVSCCLGVLDSVVGKIELGIGDTADEWGDVVDNGESWEV